MISKWLDVGVNLAAFHYQCRQYEDVRPPSFGKHPYLRNLTRERERTQQMTQEELEESIIKHEQEQQEQERPAGWRIQSYWRRLVHGKQTKKQKTRADANFKKSITCKDAGRLSLPNPQHSLHPTRQQRMANNRPSQAFDTSLLNAIMQEDDCPDKQLFTISHVDGGVKTPSLFLQEGAHLLSLMSAVAMATLRTDIMDTEPPLVEHIPGRPFPPVDPDQLSEEIRKDFNESSRLWTCVYFIAGLTRNDRHTILYNEARPFRVLGGVSDAEVEELRKARGPYAKVSLCSKWLQEFISREYMAGSTGGVSPPIISRLYQFISDGMIGYNQCRKIAYMPFPFPHAQLTILFIGIIVWVFPFLFFSFVNKVALACILNFTTVLCFVGLHEVARELENPFRNVPNDLPLTTFQAQFNEALITMYAGFNPDSWWEAPLQVEEVMMMRPVEEENEAEPVRKNGILKVSESNQEAKTVD